MTRPTAAGFFFERPTIKKEVTAIVELDSDDAIKIARETKNPVDLLAIIRVAAENLTDEGLQEVRNYLTTGSEPGAAAPELRYLNAINTFLVSVRRFAEERPFQHHNPLGDI